MSRSAADQLSPSFDNYLTTVFKQASDAVRDVDHEVLHPETQELIGNTPVMRPALLKAYERFLSIETTEGEEFSESFTAQHQFSDEIRYAYLKHEEVSLKNLQSKTFSKQLLLEEEYIKQLGRQLRLIIDSETERMVQLTQYVTAMEAKEYGVIRNLENQWKSLLNERLSSLL